MKRVIFLDFDGVMDTAHYDNYVHYMGLPDKDRFMAAGKVNRGNPLQE